MYIAYSMWDKLAVLINLEYTRMPKCPRKALEGPYQDSKGERNDFREL